jgi:hypothetical protein
MKVEKGNGRSMYGKGVDIHLTDTEVARAIDAYLTAHNIHIEGARTILINGECIKKGRVYTDPSARVFSKGVEYSGITGCEI